MQLHKALVIKMMKEKKQAAEKKNEKKNNKEAKLGEMTHNIT